MQKTKINPFLFYEFASQISFLNYLAIRDYKFHGFEKNSNDALILAKLSSKFYSNIHQANSNLIYTIEKIEEKLLIDLRNIRGDMLNKIKRIKFDKDKYFDVREKISIAYQDVRNSLSPLYNEESIV